MKKNLLADRVLRILLALTVIGVIAALMPGDGVARADYAVADAGGVDAGVSFD